MGRLLLRAMISMAALPGCTGSVEGGGDGGEPDADAAIDSAVADSAPPVDSRVVDGSGDASGDADTGTTKAPECPNEPAGYARVAEYDASALPDDSATGGAASIAGRWQHFNGRHSIVDDPTAPRSPPGVFEFLYPSGTAVGAGVGLLTGWDEGRTEMRAFYECGYVRIPSDDFETPGPGFKILGYWGVAQAAAPSIVPAQLIGWANGPGTIGLRSSFSFAVIQQGASGHALIDRRISGSGGVQLHANQWTRYEVWMNLNDVGSANGQVRMWIDGELTVDSDDVTFRNADYPSGFFGRHWAPVYGGRELDAMGDDVRKTRDDRLWVDHIYVSGEAL
jgi:hypothetical protein